MTANFGVQSRVAVIAVVWTGMGAAGDVLRTVGGRTLSAYPRGARWLTAPMAWGAVRCWRN